MMPFAARMTKQTGTNKNHKTKHSPEPCTQTLHLCAQISTCHHNAVCCSDDLIQMSQAVIRLQLGNQLNAGRLL